MTSEKSGTFKGLNYYTKPYEGYRRITKKSEIYLSDTTSQTIGVLTWRKGYINFTGLKIYIINNVQFKYDAIDKFPKTDIVLLTEKSTRIPKDIQLKFPEILFINTCCSELLYNGYSAFDNGLNMKTKFTKRSGAIIITIPAMLNDNNIRFRTSYFKN